MSTASDNADAIFSGNPYLAGVYAPMDGELTIVAPKGIKTITFDHGAAIAEARPLLDQVRVLRTRMMPKEP